MVTPYLYKLSSEARMRLRSRVRPDQRRRGRSVPAEPGAARRVCPPRSLPHVQQLRRPPSIHLVRGSRRTVRSPAVLQRNDGQGRRQSQGRAGSRPQTMAAEAEGGDGEVPR